jgi:hypothetical protein
MQSSLFKFNEMKGLAEEATKSSFKIMHIVFNWENDEAGRPCNKLVYFFLYKFSWTSHACLVFTSSSTPLSSLSFMMQGGSDGLSM